jgi:hypothetical protein
MFLLSSAVGAALQADPSGRPSPMAEESTIGDRFSPAGLIVEALEENLASY